MNMTSNNLKVVALLLLLGCCNIFTVEGKSKPLTVKLSTKWKTTPFILEASEFVAAESSEAFWNYVDNIVNFNIGKTISNSRDDYEISLKAANMAMGNQPGSIKDGLLRLSLSIRTYSPKIEMYDQLARGGESLECDTFFDVNGKHTCDIADVPKLLKENSGATSLDASDHIYPSSCSFPNNVIVYGDITQKSFKSIHLKMKDIADNQECCYILRHFVRNRPDAKARLSGYGVELAVKSTEYKAIDDSQVKDDADNTSSDDEDDVQIDGFDFETLRKLHPDVSSELSGLRNHLIESSEEMKPIKVWQLQDLSFQAAARVMAAPKDMQLKMLQDISQNFPLRVRSLVNQKVSFEVKSEIMRNRKNFGQLDVDHGESALFINQMRINLDEVDIFELLDLLRSEAQLFDGLKRLGLTGTDAEGAVGLKLQGKRDGSEDEGYILDIRHPAVVWLNDLEKDQMYKRWPANLQEFLRPAFRGSLRRIGRNVNHMLYVINPVDPQVKYLFESAEIFWVNEVPLRLGVAFLVDDSDKVDGNEDAGVALVRAYNYVKEEDSEDNSISFQFLISLYKSLPEDQVLTVEHVKKSLLKKYKDADFQDIVGINSDYDDNRAGKTFKARAGLTGDVNVVVNGQLLSESEFSVDNFEQTVIENIVQKTTFFQRAIYMGLLRNNMDVLDYVMSQPNVVPRFNPRILGANQRQLDTTGSVKSADIYRNSDKFGMLSTKEQTCILADGLKELYIAKSDGQDHVRPLTMWVVTDVNSVKGRKLLYTALKYVKSNSLTRLAVVHNPADTGDSPLIHAIECALSSQQGTTARNFITKLLKKENAAALKSGEKTIEDLFVGGMNTENYEKISQQDKAGLLSHVKTQAFWATSALGLKAGQRAVVVNGKVIGPLADNEDFTVHDFELMEILSYKGAADVIQRFVQNIRKKWTASEKSDLVMKLASHLSAHSNTKYERKPHIAGLHKQHSFIDMKQSDATVFNIFAILDPASTDAQQIVPLLQAFHQVLKANVQVSLNCQNKLSDLPVKRFYRYVLEGEPTFKVDGSFSGAKARFTDMPSKSLLTLTMHPPEGWMVEAVRAVHDLDNIRLSEIEAKEIQADYELEHLILEGHAHDLTSGSPPRGLQFTLGADSETVAVDTIVMANLGYFQLKTTPGVWYLNLRKGKSRDIYNVLSIDGNDVQGQVKIRMDSFKSRVMLVKVAKKPEMINENLLEDKQEVPQQPEEAAGIWDSIKTYARSTFGGGDGDSASDVIKSSSNSTGDVINVFSLASGHLYERLMRIMMLSVVRTTDTKVKFWILGNYISPQFKDLIPYMAEEYGFEYELVQYKWPRWLNQQTEKQRTMWGYKILFLDVLFPLDVDKIIFVDADQIVRANLKELRDLDLEGNPYGYTPFCDDRKEMDGFRFWKGGYWKNHLAGRKYHISAIYVVDLVKFREIAAGDRLRGQYQALSQDPNSLANLDQDLPNNMIHQVGIKSLPQEWLWCATWCSEESKSRAKTIDLCNNPLTKEPKLEAAVRIVSEWSDYDDEIKDLKKRWEEGIANTIKNTSSSGGKKDGQKHEEL